MAPTGYCFRFVIPVESEAFLDTGAFLDETRGIRRFGAVCHGGP